MKNHFQVLWLLLLLVAATFWSDNAIFQTELAAAVTSEKPPAITEKGFLLGYGGDRWNLTTIGPNSYRGNYQTIMLAGEFGADLSRIFPDLKSIPGVLSFYFEPAYEQGVNGGFELGLNMGFMYRLPIYDRFDGYLGLGGGPFYISTLQELNPPGTGWTMAGTVSFGASYNLPDDSAINLGLRLKHNSNGRLDWPINIYNDWYVTAGYSWFYN